MGVSSTGGAPRLSERSTFEQELVRTYEVLRSDVPAQLDPSPSIDRTGPSRRTERDRPSVPAIAAANCRLIVRCDVDRRVTG